MRLRRVILAAVAALALTVPSASASPYNERCGDGTPLGCIEHCLQYHGGARNLQECLATTMRELRAALAEGITEDELQRVKEQVKGGILLSLEDTWSVASRNGSHELRYGRVVPVEQVKVGDKLLSNGKGLALTVTTVSRGGETDAMVKLRDERGHEVMVMLIGLPYRIG